MIKIEESQIRSRIKEKLITSLISNEDLNINITSNSCAVWIRSLVYYMNPYGVIYLLNKITFCVFGHPASSVTVLRAKKIIYSPFISALTPMRLIVKIKSHISTH